MNHHLFILQFGILSVTAHASLGILHSASLDEYSQRDPAY